MHKFKLKTFSRILPAAALGAVTPLFGGPADPDPSFGVDGFLFPLSATTSSTVQRSARDILVVPDDRILAVTSQDLGLETEEDLDFTLLRFDTDGSFDPTFGGDGIVRTDFGLRRDEAVAAVLQPDGRVVVAGQSEDLNGYGGEIAVALARYNADGSLDETFGDGGRALLDLDLGPDGRVDDLALQADGKLLVSGSVSLGEGGATLFLAQIEADGEINVGFGEGYVMVPGEFAQRSAVAVQADGRIVVGSTVFPDGGPSTAVALSRYSSADGSPDTGFGSAGTALVEVSGAGESLVDVAVQPDGRILAVASLSEDAGEVGLLRLNADSTPDTGFGSGGIVILPRVENREESAQTMELQADGRILVGGAGRVRDGESFSPSLFLARFNTDGSLDAGFGEQGRSYPSVGALDARLDALALQDDGRILGSGFAVFSTGFDPETPLVARFGDAPAGASSVQFGAAGFSVAENGGSAAITITRSGDTGGSESVIFRSAAGSALAGTDYTETVQQVDFAPGETGRTVNIPILDDNLDEAGADETVSLSLEELPPEEDYGGAQTKALGSLVTATLSIVDDDVATLTLSPATASVPENGGTQVFTATLSNPSTVTVTATYAYAGTATAGIDYPTPPAGVSFAPGALTASFTGVTTDDALDEPDETIVVTVAGISNATAAPGTSITVTIRDDDAPPVQDISTDCCQGGGSTGGGLLLMGGLGLLLRRLPRRGLAALLALASFQAGAADAGDWYAGVRAGIGTAGRDGAELTQELQARGHAVTATVDDEDTAGAIYLGWQAWQKGALELALVDLGSYEAQLAGSTADPAGLARDLGELQQKACRALSLSLRWDHQLAGPLDFIARLGVFGWRNETEVSVDGERFETDESGAGLTAGAGLNLRIARGLSIGAGWELYRPDSEAAVNLFAAQVEYRFGGR